MTALLRAAGAELVAFHGEAEAMVGFGKLHPGARAAADPREILEDASIQLVVGVDVPDRRAALGEAVLAHGKDYFVDKPAAVSREQLARLRAAHERTGRHCVIFFSERLASRSTLRALALVRAGAIGEVVETIGLGPHQLGLAARPAWFFERARSGGILADLASHQMDQFLAFTGSEDARIVAARTENRLHPERPGFEDYGSVLLRSDRASGYARVDWYTPAGLGTWGDVRLTVLGTAGQLEVRKNVDPAGWPGAEHVVLVDGAETRHIDCQRDPLPFGERLLADVVERRCSAQDPALAFRAQDLALEAQALSSRPAERGGR
ncbi:MAG: Gfo/Idh/MocA family oxidoreductase [Myxococcales bacterium]|nr:Gfo/Idh/MocA family oxidoreductase [Myxococcales bacterium]